MTSDVSAGSFILVSDLWRLSRLLYAGLHLIAGNICTYISRWTQLQRDSTWILTGVLAHRIPPKNRAAYINSSYLVYHFISYHKWTKLHADSTWILTCVIAHRIPPKNRAVYLSHLYFISSPLISFHLISSHLISSHLIISHLILSHLILSHLNILMASYTTSSSS